MFSASTALKKAGTMSLATVAALGSFAPMALAEPSHVDYTSQANKALNWIKTQQQPDGSFQGFGAGSTVDVVLAFVAARQSPDNFLAGGKPPIAFLQSKAADLAKTPGGAGKLLIAVNALVMNDKSFGGINLVDMINAGYDANTGQYGKDVIGHAYAMLGLSSASNHPPVKAIEFLKSAQTPEGGWAFSGDTKPGAADTNTTAVVIQALVAAGADKTESTVLKKAVSYLYSQQNPNGGFPYQKGDPQSSESDVNSTAYVGQALLSLGYTGQAPLDPGVNAAASRALAFISSLQKPNGAFQWKKSEPDDNAGATYQAVPALLYATLTAPYVPQNVSENPSPTATIPSADVPGMPTTGNSLDGLITALAALVALLMGAGVVARHKAVVR